MITITIIILALSVIMISCTLKTPPEPTTGTLTFEPAMGRATDPVEKQENAADGFDLQLKCRLLSKG